MQLIGLKRILLIPATDLIIKEGAYNYIQIGINLKFTLEN